MNMKIKTLTLLAVGTALFLGGCSKNSIDINLGNTPGSDDSSGNSNGSQTLVTFSATVEARNMTRALSPMAKGIESQLYAFETAKGTSLGTPTAEGRYITVAPGLLTGVDGYRMYLGNGVYNFYAVSENNSDNVPSFAAGKSDVLESGVDYLWWKGALQDVSSSQVTIPIVYLHVATQVVFEVSTGTNLKLDSLVSATITPSKRGQSMYLNTGEIPPASDYDPAVPMGINGFTAQYIMIPLQTSMPMHLTLVVKVDGETEPRTYDVDVPLPGGELKAGDSYLFRALIDENRVTFPVVTVKAWTEVDETGKPLYPNQE